MYGETQEQADGATPRRRRGAVSKHGTIEPPCPFPVRPSSLPPPTSFPTLCLYPPPTPMTPTAFGMDTHDAFVRPRPTRALYGVRTRCFRCEDEKASINPHTSEGYEIKPRESDERRSGQRPDSPNPVEAMCWDGPLCFRQWIVATSIALTVPFGIPSTHSVYSSGIPVESPPPDGNPSLSSRLSSPHPCLSQTPVHRIPAQDLWPSCLLHPLRVCSLSPYASSDALPHLFSCDYDADLRSPQPLFPSRSGYTRHRRSSRLPESKTDRSSAQNWGLDALDARGRGFRKLVR